jgi:hypothetical protein
MPVSLPEDEAHFLFVFDALTPFNPRNGTATYFDTHGDFDFAQIDLNCGGTLCGSPPPNIYGVDLSITGTTIPEPASIWMLGFSLALLGLGRVGAAFLASAALCRLRRLSSFSGVLALPQSRETAEIALRTEQLV